MTVLDLNHVGRRNVNSTPRWNLAATLARFLAEQRTPLVVLSLGLVAPDCHPRQMAGATPASPAVLYPIICLERRFK